MKFVPRKIPVIRSASLRPAVKFMLEGCTDEQAAREWKMRPLPDGSERVVVRLMKFQLVGTVSWGSFGIEIGNRNFGYEEVEDAVADFKELRDAGFPYEFDEESLETVLKNEGLSE